MPIDGGMRKSLVAGTRLVATYRKLEYTAEVIAGEGGKLRFDTPTELPDSTYPFTAWDEDPPKPAIDDDGQVAVAWMTRPMSWNDGAVIAVARPNLDRDGRITITRIEPSDRKAFLLCESLHYDDDGRLLAVWIDGGAEGNSKTGRYESRASSMVLKPCSSRSQ